MEHCKGMLLSDNRVLNIGAAVVFPAAAKKSRSLIVYFNLIFKKNTQYCTILFVTQKLPAFSQLRGRYQDQNFAWSVFRQCKLLHEIEGEKIT